MRVGSRCSVPANLDWIKLYRAVLKESDLQKRLAEIEEAERVMKQALRSAVEEGDSDQRRSISDALHQLEIIRRGERLRSRYAQHRTRLRPLQSAENQRRKAPE